jgi:hypothetical protein
MFTKKLSIADMNMLDDKRHFCSVYYFSKTIRSHNLYMPALAESLSQVVIIDWQHETFSSGF